MKNSYWSLVREWILLLVCCFFSTLATAQRPLADEGRRLYPDASAIYLNKTYSFKIFLENNLPTGVCTIQELLLVNKESGIGKQKKSISSSSFIKAQNIKASTLVPKGNNYDRKKVENIELRDDLDHKTFFDDDKSYNFIYPSVQPGALLDLSYELRYTEPRFLGRFFWIDFLPTLESELVIAVENNINIQYKLFNCENKTIVFTKEVTKKETIYRWKLKNVATEIFYEDGPSYAYYEPNMIFYITDYKENGEVKKLLGSPKELYEWYSSLQKNVNKIEDKNLKQLTDSLVNGITSEEEKVKKIFYWVQDNISYLAIEDGFGGFIPRDAGLVCSRKFGDCKDMSSIIHEMLKMAGVKSYLTWIGSRDIPYTYMDVPTPAVDNHMITSYRDPKGVWYFLDATGTDASWDITTSFIQGKQAMIGISPDSFLLVTVPIRDTSISQVVDSVFLELKQDQIHGNGKINLTGYDRLDYLHHMENLDQEEREKYFKGYFSKGSNKTSFSDLSYVNESRIAPLHLTYSVQLTDYAKIHKNELYVNLNVGSDWGLELMKKDRKVPLSFKHVTSKKLVTIFTIPSGYTVQTIPENKEKKNHVVGYSTSYQIKGDKIYFTNQFYINTLILKVEDFDKFNEVINDLNKANKQTVSLIKL